jgi:GNAT superfamily N-acetyltransferase
MKVEFILQEETLYLRSHVLRPGQDIANCIYPMDFDSKTFHLGIRNQSGKIICNGTFVNEVSPLFLNSKNMYRLRGMATDFSEQQKGCGKMLLQFAEKELTRRDSEYLWFNARTVAIGFYEKLGYQIKGNEFDIPTVGPHYVMWKKLSL